LISASVTFGYKKEAFQVFHSPAAHMRVRSKKIGVFASEAMFTAVLLRKRHLLNRSVHTVWGTQDGVTIYSTLTQPIRFDKEDPATTRVEIEHLGDRGFLVDNVRGTEIR
jgi:hypothetical protein